MEEVNVPEKLASDLSFKRRKDNFFLGSYYKAKCSFIGGRVPDGKREMEKLDLFIATSMLKLERMSSNVTGKTGGGKGDRGRQRKKIFDELKE